MQNTEVCAALERATDVMLESWLNPSRWIGPGVKNYIYMQGDLRPLTSNTLSKITIHDIIYIFQSYINTYQKKYPTIYLIQEANFKCEKTSATINKYTNSFVEAAASVAGRLNADRTALDVEKPVCMLFLKPTTQVTINNMSSEFTAEMAKKFPYVP